MQGQLVDSGCVDSVTDDGAILWLVNPAQIRKLYEKAEYYEAWVAGEPALRPGTAAGRTSHPGRLQARPDAGLEREYLR